MHGHSLSLLLTAFFSINVMLGVILHLLTRLQFPNPPRRIEVVVHFLAFAVFGIPLALGAMVWHLIRGLKRGREGS